MVVHLITIEVTNQTWWGLCGSVFPPSLFLSLPVNLAKVDVRAGHRIWWKTSTMDTLSAHEYAIHLLDPLPSIIVGEKKQRNLIRPTSTQAPGGEEAWRTIIFNNRRGKWWLYLFVTSYQKKCFFYVNLAWEEVTGPCTCAEPSRTAFPNGVRTEKYIYRWYWKYKNTIKAGGSTAFEQNVDWVSGWSGWYPLDCYDY